MTSQTNSQINLESLPAGSLIDVETRSRHYSIECLGGHAVRVSGHPDYCETPMPAELYGSVHEAGGIGIGMIEPGSRLMFLMKGRGPMTTSKVLSVNVEQPVSASVH